MITYEKLTGGVYTIAEMSANHAGKLENALAIVHAARDAGADCLKIQTYTADTLTIDCDNEYFRIRGGLWDGRTLYDLYQQAYTPWEWQPAIKRECDRLGLDFLSTPFDSTAVDFLDEMGVSAYKIASFELVDIPLIAYTASQGKPMILSCGMGSAEEIQDAIDACKSAGNEQIVLLKCCSEYPASYGDMNLATITDMRARFHLPVGLSDHSMGHLAAVVGVSLGACVVEKHFCLSRSIKNPDSAFSMEPDEFRDMVLQTRQAFEIRGSATYARTKSEQASTAFRKSIFAIEAIRKGEPFTRKNVRVIRPGHGLAPKRIDALLGSFAKRDIRRGEPIRPEDAD